MPQNDEINFASLRHEAMRELERLTPDQNAQWTDFNSHDPGITIQEQVCWALADLAYRLDHPMPDLIAEAAHSGLAEPAQILSCAPVTLNDLRRLVLDIEGVANVWIEADPYPEPRLFYNYVRNNLDVRQQPAETEPLALQGLWKVWVAAHKDANPAELKKAVQKRLYENRPLCQDFSQIDILPIQAIKVHADIEIGPIADAESLLLKIMQRIDQYISPAPPFKSRQHTKAPLEQLYDGPLLEQGFIQDQDLPDSKRRSQLRVSDLIRVIMDTPGVKAVRHIRLSSQADEAQDWVLNLEPGYAPGFDKDANSLRLYRKQVQLQLDSEQINQRWHTPSPSQPQTGSHPATSGLNTGRKRHIADYVSILHQFPTLYGVGTAGLPADASAQRIAQMQQLKAYLQFFDQSLADCHAQAANAMHMLAAEAGDVYAAGHIQAQGLELDSVRQSPDQYQAEQQWHAHQISQSAEGRNLRRRQLDHLLARQGETFIDPLTQQANSNNGVEQRQQLLNDLPQLAATRGKVDGLQKRIARKLGLRDQGDFYLLEHILLRAIEGDQTQSVPLLQQLAAADPYSFQLSMVCKRHTSELAQLQPDFVERSVREETPAHISLYIHWLDQDAWDAFIQILRDYHYYGHGINDEHD